MKYRYFLDRVRSIALVSFLAVTALTIVRPADAAPRYRGVTLSPDVTDQDLIDLKGWKANLVRYQIAWLGPVDTATEAEYNAWLEGIALPRLDQVLALCQTLKIKVVVDLHTPPGGFVSRVSPAQFRVFSEKSFQDSLISNWQKIAARYRGNPAVFGYDILNEPAQKTVAPGLLTWSALAPVISKAIRAIDPKVTIIVEPIYGDQARLGGLKPLKLKNILYSVHLYYPWSFLHQGLYGVPVGGKYPKGKVNPVALLKSMKGVFAYQKKHKAKFYIGEFSTSRWSPGKSGMLYLRDLIRIFEKNKFDWTYHSWREANAWSLEHGSGYLDPTVSPTLTDRAKVVRSYFAKNK